MFLFFKRNSNLFFIEQKVANVFVKFFLIPKNRSASFSKDVAFFSTGTASVSSSFFNNNNIQIDELRNIGISAHIDAGKTTLTERILFYTGKIKSIHEVKGSDGIGATMDSMDLEREKGITIQSAATNCSWLVHNKKYNINIIDTPGHVDFTIEVERSLRVLDAAILVICAVSGVQSQTLTVNAQMNRYGIPRILFLNKLDRDGANIERSLKSIEQKLNLNTLLLQIPIGIEQKLKGVYDLLLQKGFLFKGTNGIEVEEINDEDIQTYDRSFSWTMKEEYRNKIFEKLADLDDEFADIYLSYDLNEIPIDTVIRTIRKCTIRNGLTPICLGSAKTNIGVQILLNYICLLLPSPKEIENYGFEYGSSVRNETEYTEKYKEEEKNNTQLINNKNDRKRVELICDKNLPMIGFLFKIQEDPLHGQMSYFRLYQGKIRKKDMIMNMITHQKETVRKIMKMHSNMAKEIEEATAGDIVALNGLTGATGTTYTNGIHSNLHLLSIHVPKPVISVAIELLKKSDMSKLTKALKKFTKEDPTFLVKVDPLTKETIFEGIGELQLDIYKERLNREFNICVNLKNPKIHFKETITKPYECSYTYKKQKGGAGLYAHVHAIFEPISDNPNNTPQSIFQNEVIGNDLPKNFIQSIEKAYKELLEKGFLFNSEIINMKMRLISGKIHEVDSNDLAFKKATFHLIKENYSNFCPVLLEPIMLVEIISNYEHQANILTSITKRKGLVTNILNNGNITYIYADIPLKHMFNYINEIRAITQGQGTYTMEFSKYEPVSKNDLEEILKQKKDIDQ